MKALLLALLAGCGPTLAGVSTAAITVDWAQTRTYTPRCIETNPIIGRCGQRIPPDVYFPLAAAANLATGMALGKYGPAFWAFVAGVELTTAYFNTETP